MKLTSFVIFSTYACTMTVVKAQSTNGPIKAASLAPMIKYVTSPKRTFEFNNLKSGVEINTRLYSCSFSPTASQVVASCSLPISMLLHKHSHEDESLGFDVYKGMLANLNFVAPRREFTNVVSVLSSRYGPPCVRQGRSHTDEVFTWCFTSGSLIARHTSFRQGTMSFQYKDTVTQPAYEAATEGFLDDKDDGSQRINERE